MKTITTTAMMTTMKMTSSPTAHSQTGSIAEWAKAGCRATATALVLTLALPTSLALLRGTSMSAQKGPVQRIAEGTVEDKDGAAVKGAVVYLKDTKSLSVKSYVANDSGYFHFTQLNPDTDYELWAEHEGARSKNKGISSFDSRKSFHFTLKLGE